MQPYALRTTVSHRVYMQLTRSNQVPRFLLHIFSVAFLHTHVSLVEISLGNQFSLISYMVMETSFSVYVKNSPSPKNKLYLLI